MASVYGSGNSYYSPFIIYQIGAIWYLPAAWFSSVILRWSLDYGYIKRIIILVGTYACGYLSSKYMFGFPMSIQAGACSALFMYVGWNYRNNGKLGAKLEIKAFGLFIAIMIWSDFISSFQGFYLVRNYYGRGIIDIIGALCASVIIIYIASILDKKTKYIKRVLVYFGRYSLLILCVHIVELNFFPWHGIVCPITGFSHGQCDMLLVFIKPILIILVVAALLKTRLIKRAFGYETFLDCYSCCYIGDNFGALCFALRLQFGT